MESTSPQEHMVHRLNRIQGQIEGLKKGIASSEKNCSDVLHQIKAARNALRKVGEIYAETSMCECIDENLSSTAKKKHITDTLKAILRQ